MEKKIQDFIYSGQTEAEFFHLSNGDTITLGDYIQQRNEKDAEFLKLVKEPIQSIKKKCSWLDDIAFHGLQQHHTKDYLMSSIWLFPTSGTPLITHVDKDSGQFLDLAERIPKLYLLRKSTRELVRRQKELVKLQRELHEIDEAGCDFYLDSLYPQTSISGHFHLHHTPNIGVHVFADDESLANFFVRPMKTYDKPYLDDSEKNKVLAKIQLKQSQD